MIFIILYIIIAIVFDFYIFRNLGIIFFDSYDEFMESIRYVFTPDFVSFFRGRKEYYNDKVSEFKLGFFIFICMVIIGAEYLLLMVFL